MWLLKCKVGSAENQVAELVWISRSITWIEKLWSVVKGDYAILSAINPKWTGTWVRTEHNDFMNRISSAFFIIDRTYDSTFLDAAKND